jgi:hypothetical protein
MDACGCCWPHACTWLVDIHVDCRIAVVVVVGGGGDSGRGGGGGGGGGGGRGGGGRGRGRGGAGDRVIHRRSSNTVYLFDVCE